MEPFNISWVAILKIMGAGAFSYIVLPALLVLRDLILHAMIGKVILTDELNRLIRICENDRWFLNNEYNKVVKISFGSNGKIYKIDDESVTKENFGGYEKGRNFHLKRFEYADSKIVLKHNLITWITKHYRQAEGGNPIPSLRKKYYETAGSIEEVNNQ